MDTLLCISSVWGQRPARHAVPPAALDPWPLRLHALPVIDLVAFCTRPLSTPRQGHVGMDGDTNLTAKVPVGMSVDRCPWGLLGPRDSCFRRIKEKSCGST
jgi:hypothetical protein